MKRIAMWILCLMAAIMPHAAQGDMIRGLKELPVISVEEIAQLPKVTGEVTLTLGNHPLPRDSETGHYLIPQDAGTRHFDGSVRLQKQEGFTYYITAGDEYTKQDALARGTGFMIFGVSETECLASGVIFTSLPVLMIDTQHGALPGEEDESGFLRLYSAENGTIRCEETPIEINLRGNTSKRLPKQSYRVKIVDEHGEKDNLSIAGLRSDDDWILNPMYTDTSKVREKLAYELWAAMNSSGQRAQSSRLEYAELYIDGRYWGLYGVQERIDRKQVDASKRSGILYKIAANDRPTVEELLLCENREACRGMELVYAGAMVTDPWEPAAGLIRYLDGGEAGKTRMVLENIIDYGLWAMVTQAHDCHFKNQYIHCAYEGEGYVMYKIPWDLNHTFGDCWSTEATESNNTEYYIGDLVVDGVFGQLVMTGNDAVYDMIRSRWAQLRGGAVQLEDIMARAQAIFDSILPALARDNARWPEGGMGEGNSMSLKDIEVSLRDALERIDEYVAQLGAPETEEAGE
mgnify:CR=1 FL=1